MMPKPSMPNQCTAMCSHSPVRRSIASLERAKRWHNKTNRR